MIIAIDIGTTNVKVIAFNLEGRVLCEEARQNQTFQPQEGWSEQSAEAVFQNVLAGLQQVMTQIASGYSSPQCIVFSAAMHGLVAVDQDGIPLTPVMLWSDTRAASMVAEMTQNDGIGQEIYQRTGVPIHPMSPLLKLIWMRQHMPNVFKNAHKFLGIKEYVWFRLSGKFESDISCASATGLMNLLDNSWDEVALRAAGINVEQLPTLVMPGHCAISTFSDLPMLMIGASDGALANLGCGASQAGQYAVTIGTSAAIRCITPIPILDHPMRTFCYRLDAGHFIVGGASNNGANTLEWLRTSVFQSNLTPDDFANQAKTIPSGAEGLRFIPYLYGERAPIWDAFAKASFEGITGRHTQAHFVRAVMEGVLLNLKAIGVVLEESIPIKSIQISGGFSRNQLWVEMLSEVFDKPVMVNSLGVDASAYGAFLYAKANLASVE